MMRTNIIFIVLFVLTLLDTGINVSLADVGGTWKIIGLDADSMSLTQVGKVYGTYNTHQGHTIDGTINAQNVWIGTWSEPFDNALGYSLRSFPMIALI
jgi:hypothetical protein